MAGKQILLFSTLNPFPFWAGSENLWYDLLQWKGSDEFQFHVQLADSPVTREKATLLSKLGIKVSFYPHLNVNFLLRNTQRVKDRIRRSAHRSFPWYHAIKKGQYDLVFFNVAALADLADLSYGINICEEKGIPYCLLLQHGYEDFFLNSEKEIETVISVATKAKHFIFIAEKNRLSLERAIGKKLSNAVHSVNAIPASFIEKATAFSHQHSVNTSGTAKFFNLGRFSPRDKAQHLLLEAFSTGEWRHRDWELSFIGVAGFGQTYLEKLIQFYGLEHKRIKIVPPTDNVIEEIVKHDVLLMPSIAEGTPFAMIESMACGRPALGTPVGGIPELIRNNETGWLCNSVSSRDIAVKLEEAWQQRSQWKEFGLQAQQQIIKNYNQEITFPGLLKILRDDTN